jgi:hypothetical protein
MRLHEKGLILATVIGLYIVLLHSSYAQQDRFIPHAKAFLASPEGGGEENALSNYVRAMEQFDTQVYLQHQQTFDHILKSGWTGSEQNEMNILRSLQPILSEIWHGNEKEFVKYPPFESGQEPVPSLEKNQVLGKLMIIQGLYCEHIKRPDYAMQWFRHSVIFGQRICDSHSRVIMKLISIAIEELALNTFQQFFVRHNLGKDAYLKIANDLTMLRSSDTPFWQAKKNEHRIAHTLIKNLDAAPDELQTLPPEKQERIKYIISNKDAVLKQFSAFAQKLESLLQEDLPVIIRTDFDTLTADLPPSLAMSGAVPVEPRIREGRTYALWAVTIVTAQILAYRAQKGTLPPNLFALSEIGVTAPKDPFSPTMAVKYVQRGNSSLLYSIGPDLTDNGGSPAYDPTNGTISSGDIIANVQ